jgi:predicted Zn-dependent protease with MMP-like domain
MAATPFSDPLARHSVGEPSLDEFEAIAAEAFRRLPSKFRALCEAPRGGG